MTCAQCGAENPGEKGQCPDCSPSLAQTAATLIDHAATGTVPSLGRPAPAPRFEPGQAFGERYTIVEEVGAGGMGQVYKAIDRRLGKTVALKLIRPDIAAQSETLRRFQRELALAQEVSHPNVCRVHDLGELEGIVYISMEYVEGQTLEDLIQSVGQLSPKQAVGLGRQACTALQAIHDKGIVHRDLKPRNVMVDRVGHAIVMDFGMAYHHDRDHITEAGAVLGTLAYLSPEQARGEAADARSDVYALGLNLFEMLTGRRPPADGVALPLALRESGERCPPPSHFAPDVPPALDQVVLRCLDRDPGRRFASMVELEQALAHAGASLSSSVPLRSLARRFLARRPAPSRRLLVVATAGSASVLAIVIALSRTGRPPPLAPGRGPVVAVLPLANVGADPADEYLGVGIADSLITKLASLPAVTVVSRSATLESRELARDTRRIARDLGVTYLVNGAVQRVDRRLRITVNLVRPDDSVAWGGEFEGSLDDLFALQRRVAESLGAALRLTLTSADRERLARPPTSDFEAFADYSRARALIQRPDVSGNVGRAIEAYQRALQRDPKFALAHAGLGEAYWERYQETKDPIWATKALDSITEALRLAPEQAQTRVALARVYRGTGRVEVAVEELRRALTLQPEDEQTHGLLGDILAEQGRGDEAIAEIRRAIDLRPEYWRNHASLGYAYYRMGRYAEAVAAFRRATELQPDDARALQMLGAAYQAGGDDARAIENYERANAIRPDARAYGNIGTIHYVKGRFPEAARALEESVRLDPNGAKQLRYLGDTYRQLGEPAKAREHYLRAVAVCESHLRVNPADAQALSLLALSEAKLGRSAEARRHIAGAVALLPNDPDVFYRKAVVHILTRETTEAMSALEVAVKHGFSPVLARHDHDLAPLRALPAYKALIPDKP